MIPITPFTFAILHCNVGIYLFIVLYNSATKTKQYKKPSCKK